MIHIDDIPIFTETHGDDYEIRVKLLGAEAGGRDLAMARWSFAVRHYNRHGMAPTMDGSPGRVVMPGCLRM
jgi:hypothetical protein